jgi:hypothetical protein
MSADIVSLRKARKQKARADKERRAAENRAVHGLSKVERERQAREKDRVRREIEGAKRTPPVGGDGDDHG